MKPLPILLFIPSAFSPSSSSPSLPSPPNANTLPSTPPHSTPSPPNPVLTPVSEGMGAGTVSSSQLYSDLHNPSIHHTVAILVVCSYFTSTTCSWLHLHKHQSSIAQQWRQTSWQALSLSEMESEFPAHVEFPDYFHSCVGICHEKEKQTWLYPRCQNSQISLQGNNRMTVLSLVRF